MTTSSILFRLCVELPCCRLSARSQTCMPWSDADYWLSSSFIVQTRYTRVHLFKIYQPRGDEKGQNDLGKGLFRK